MRLTLCLAAVTLCIAPAAFAQAPPPTGIEALDTCAAAIVANKDSAKQVTLCKAGDEAAVGKGPKFRVMAFEYTAEAMLRNNEPAHALAQASHAVEYLDRGKIDDSLAARAYLIRAHCHEALNGVLQASDDAAKAEEFQRKAFVAYPDDPNVKATLKSILLYESQLFKAQRRDGDAIGKRVEASKL